MQKGKKRKEEERKKEEEEDERKKEEDGVRVRKSQCRQNEGGRRRSAVQTDPFCERA